MWFYLKLQKNLKILLIEMIKLDSAYKTIGEVAEILHLVNKKKGSLNTHTIRFWEKEFKQIKPKILNGNRRYYDDKAINVLKKIKYLLKDQGMTINGVKKVLNSDKPLKLDEPLNNPINTIKLKNKLKKISNIIKQIKKQK
jgi:DNA-binding transcriptional MerR regulator